VSDDAPPARPAARGDAGRTVVGAARGGMFALICLIGACQLLAVVGFILIGAYGFWSWAKIGLLSGLLALRADVVTVVSGSPFLPPPAAPATLRWRFVPMLLTLVFLWLAARAGRRAARARRGGSVIVTCALAAIGAGIPVAALAALAAAVVTLSFPNLGLTMRVDVGTAALWGAILAAAGAATGAYLEATRDGFAAVALRGGLSAYGWALGLLAVVVLVVATLEPNVTRAYVDGLGELGAGGQVVIGYHLLAFPAQSALLMAPASGSCLEILGEGSALSLCPWRLAASGGAGGLLPPDPVPLSPWLWMSNAVPPIAAFLGGRRAASGAAGRRAIALGAAAGTTFASIALVAAWFVVPRSVAPGPDLRLVSVEPAWLATTVTILVWGLAGGTLGGWLSGRSYEGPGAPRPTSV
jgi:hypothetical protein